MEKRHHLSSAGFAVVYFRFEAPSVNFIPLLHLFMYLLCDTMDKKIDFAMAY